MELVFFVVADFARVVGKIRGLGLGFEWGAETWGNKANFSWGWADEVLDTLLDQEGLEVDPVDTLEADIPLHKAVRFVNGLSKEQWDVGASLVELLLDAGANPKSVPPHPPPPPFSVC